MDVFDVADHSDDPRGDGGDYTLLQVKQILQDYPVGLLLSVSCIGPSPSHKYISTIDIYQLYFGRKEEMEYNCSFTFQYLITSDIHEIRYTL